MYMSEGLDCLYKRVSNLRIFYGEAQTGFIGCKITILGL